MRVFGTKGDENGEWKRLQNETLHSLYSSSNRIRAIKCIRPRGELGVFSKHSKQS